MMRILARSSSSSGPSCGGPTALARQPKVNLGSTPDQKGYWEIRPGLGGLPRAADVPFQPWAKALYDYRKSRTDLYPPLVRCKPAGGPGFFNAPGFEIVDVPDQRRIFILNIAGPHSWRVIYTDGRRASDRACGRRTSATRSAGGRATRWSSTRWASTKSSGWSAATRRPSGCT